MASGTRVGLPVTTIRDTSTCTFKNYNGIGTRPRGSGKILILITLVSTNLGRVSCFAMEGALKTSVAMGGVREMEVVAS